MVYLPPNVNVHVNVIASNFHLSIAYVIASTYAPSPRHMVNTRRMEKSIYCNIFKIFSTS
jgi:hypothetical protein